MRSLSATCYLYATFGTINVAIPQTSNISNDSPVLLDPLVLAEILSISNDQYYSTYSKLLHDPVLLKHTYLLITKLI